ncbi:MAG: EAL domain-containing protein [Gammaproteobacteria bacterium]|nr:EAL domain-containing protein [Gammaproteobacteria bacterium]
MTTQPEPPASPLRVLIADDEAVIRESYRDILAPNSSKTPAGDKFGAMKAQLFGADTQPAERPQIEVVCCEQAEQAVDAVVQALAAGQPFAVAFLDIRMPPGKDGVWAAEQIRALDPDIEIVIVTAYSDVDPQEIAARVPPVDKLLYLQKPFHPHEVRQCVSSLGAKWRGAQSLRKNQVRLETAQRIAKFGYWELDPQTGYAWWSRELCNVFGLPVDHCSGPIQTLWSRIHPDDEPQVQVAINRAVRERTARSLEYRIRAPDGSERYIRQEVIATDAEDNVCRMIGAVQDVTERKVMENQIRHLAYFDQLTELPNRTFLTKHLTYVLSQAKRYERTVALLYVDLDNFKRINDTFGHSRGDDLLREVSVRLKACVRESDVVTHASRPERPSPMDKSGTDTIIRFGGDEFIVLLSEVAHVQDAARVARRIIRALEVPVRFDATDVVVGASIGIALYPNDGDTDEVLLKNADAAMYHAKENGRNNFQFYTETLNATAFERLSLEADLRHAIETDELILHYQPKISVVDGTVVGAEALVRWHHPELGMVGPGEFIPIAEETGLIVPLGEFVLRTACNQIKQWEDAGVRMPISINVSFRQFRDQSLISQARQALAATGISPHLLEIEFTESAVMEDTRASDRLLAELKALGLSISLDDFGTGYSSLSRLKRLPIDILKIDQSFVSDLLTSADDEAIVTAIIAMAHHMKLTVVAEGVETQAQLDILSHHGCDIMQGYLVSPAVPPGEFESRFLNGESQLEVAV